MENCDGAVNLQDETIWTTSGDAIKFFFFSLGFPFGLSNNVVFIF
jgi:hypothetical protein